MPIRKMEVEYVLFRERVVKMGGFLKNIILEYFGLCKEYIIEIVKIVINN